MSNEQTTAQHNLNMILAKLDTIFVSVRITYAVQLMLTNAQKHIIWIELGCFFALLNLFYTQFHLDIVEKLINSSAAWINSVDITLRVVLISSFIFAVWLSVISMSFDVLNLCIFFCNLRMVEKMLVTISYLLITFQLRENIKHMHFNRLASITVSLIFYFFHKNTLENMLLEARFMIFIFIKMPINTIHKLVNLSAKNIIALGYSYIV